MLCARVGLEPDAECYVLAPTSARGVAAIEPIAGASGDPGGARPKPALVYAGDHLAHVADLGEALRTLGGFGAVMVLDIPYLGAALSDLALDRICAAPQPALSLVALEPLLAAAGLKPFDAEPLADGWLRLFAAPARQARAERVGLMRVRQAEAAARLARADGYSDFAPRLARAVEGLSDFLSSARHGHKSVAAIGSPQAARLLSKADAIRPGDLAYLVPADGPTGQDLSDLPAPVAGPDELRRRRPDFLLMLPGQDRARLLADCADLRRLGTCFVSAFPTVTLIA